MPNAGAHKSLTILAGFCAFPVVFVLSVPEIAAFYGGILTTFWINPDADLVQKAGKMGGVLGFEDYEDR